MTSLRPPAFVLTAALGLSLVACAAGAPKDPAAARAAVYSADQSALFQEMAVTIKQHYKNIAVNPATGTVKTAWHPLAIDDKRDGSESSRWGNQPVGKDDNAGYREHRRRSTTEPTRYFVRFDVALVPVGAPGQPQFRVSVTGHASLYDPRGVPTPLTGEERPYWLDTRVANLEVAIYERLRQTTVATR